MFSEFFNKAGNWFSIDKPVTGASDVTSPDAFNTQNALTNLGHFNLQTPDIGEGLKSFQAAQGLKVDGIMNPGGPTESALSKALADQALNTTTNDQKLPAHISITKPDHSNENNRSWSASASFGPKLKKPAPQATPSALPQKSKAQMDKLWAQVPQQPTFMPKTAQKQETVMDRLKDMMNDPRYAKDATYTQHLQNQFKKAFPGTVQRDETSQMIQPKATIHPDEVENFDAVNPFKQHNSSEIRLELNDAQNQSKLSDAYDDKSHTLFKTDKKGNYFNFKDEPISLPPDVKKRLDAAYLDKKQLSSAGVEEMGSYLAHRQSRGNYTPERLKATEQAIKSTYSEEEQNRIREHAEQNPHGIMPENHDVWRGNLHVMAKVMELDEKNLKKAGNAAIPAMTAMMSYRKLATPESKQKALTAIYDLDRQSHSKLARDLLGKLAVSQVAPAFEKTSQSNKELLTQKKNHNDLEKFTNMTSRLPFPLPSVNVGLSFLEENFKKAQENDLKELDRRKRSH